MDVGFNYKYKFPKIQNVFPAIHYLQKNRVLVINKLTWKNTVSPNYLFLKQIFSKTIEFDFKDSV